MSDCLMAKPEKTPTHTEKTHFNNEKRLRNAAGISRISRLFINSRKLSRAKLWKPNSLSDKKSEEEYTIISVWARALL